MAGARGFKAVTIAEEIEVFRRALADCPVSKGPISRLLASHDKLVAALRDIADTLTNSREFAPLRAKAALASLTEPIEGESK